MITKIITICITGLCLLFIGIVIAGEGIPDVIQFEGSSDGGGTDDVHPSAYTGQVTFQHIKHAEEYTEGCGSCHHDSDMEPIEDFDTDVVYTCIDCHDSEGLIRGPLAENTHSEDELIEHRANVIHMVCINCHTEYNSQQHSVTAPEACRKCHEKRPVDYAVE